MRGAEELRHEADVVLSVEGMRWQVTKSRYELPGANGDVLAAHAEKEDHAAAE